MSTEIKITETLDAGNDVLLVRGTVDGVPVEARGWMTAMTNHFDEDAYEEVPEPGTSEEHEGRAAGRHLKANAKSREMTPTEKRAYCERLLAQVAPRPADAPKPVLLF